MRLPLAPAIALSLGAVAAFGIAAMPVPIVESFVVDSGLPALFPAAEPPLGDTARVLLALLAAGIVAAVTGLTGYILFGRASVALGGDRAPARSSDPDAVRMPVLRRADAHPDAPPRPPLLATRDLGSPFAGELAEVAALRESRETPPPPEAPPAAERPLPVDLDQALAAFDPAAIPAIPITPPIPRRRVSTRPPVYSPAERFETFELNPPAPARAPQPRPEAITRPETEATVHALLERLERGVSRRGAASSRPQATIAPRRAQHGLEDALATLRNLARQA